MMNVMANIELFIGGCRMCSSAVKVVEEVIGANDSLEVYDLREGSETPTGLDRAAHFGVHQVPAIAVDGRILSEEITVELLRKAGVGA